MWIIGQQVLRHPSKHGTSLLGIQLWPEGYIAKLNKLSELEFTKLTSSTVNETALAILMTQGSRGIQILSFQRKFTFNI
jgi:hypothetical protein